MSATDTTRGDASRTRRLLVLAKLAATTLAALVTVAKAIGLV